MEYVFSVQFPSSFRILYQSRTSERYSCTFRSEDSMSEYHALELYCGLHMVRLRKQNHLSSVKWINYTWNFPYTNAVTIESVHTSSFCRLGLIPVSLIESINSKYVDCKFGACCFRYEFTKSAGTFSDKKSSIVSDGLRSRTYKEDSKTSVGSDLQRGCKWKGNIKSAK